MLEVLKRWLSGRQAAVAFPPVEAWARSREFGFKRVREGGFVVDGGEAGWRLEVGASQREYIDGPELRLRAERPLPPDLQMLVMTRPLMEALERETFLQFTDSLQTYADDSAPEEMRWLAMFRKLGAATLGELAPRFGAVALVPEAAQAWLAGEFAARLRAAALALPPEQPLVLMTNRGRVTLRTEAQTLAGESLANWVALYESALAQLPPAVEALRSHAG